MKSIKNLGFTLVELLVVIALIGIMSILAIPAFMSQLRDMEASQVESSLTNLLKSAKQDAIIYQNPITVCIANQQLVCSAKDGELLLSFIDKNDNHLYEKDIDILRENSPLSLRYGKVHLETALNKNYVDFKSNNGSPIGYMGHISYCPNNKSPTNMFKITFNKTGIIKTKYNKEEPTDC